MAKVLFQVIVFNGMPFLESCLESIIPFGDVIAVEGPVTYWQKRGYTTSTDGTNAILAQMLRPGNVIHGCWKEKDAMLTAAESMIPDGVTHIFCVDSDEVWKAYDLQKILAKLDDYDSVAFRPYSFYGGFERYMTGYEEDSPPWGWQRIQRWYPGAHWYTHRPPTIMHEDNEPMRAHRHWTHKQTDAEGIRFYHYSYVLPAQMNSKADYYHSRNEAGTVIEYMMRVYLPWVRGDDKAKAKIEKRFGGVHNERNVNCPTTRFEGTHPESIAIRLPELREQFNRELMGFS